MSKDITVTFTGKEILALQHLFYSTISEEDHERVRRRERHPTEMGTITMVNPDGSKTPPGKRSLNMNDVIPDEELRALWLKIEDESERQDPFTVL